MTKAVNKQLEELQQIVNDMANQRKIIKAAVSRFIQAMSEGKVEISVSDYEKLIKLDIKIKSEQTRYMAILKNLKR